MQSDINQNKQIEKCQIPNFFLQIYFIFTDGNSLHKGQ